jgi:hypothetical protein
MRREVLAVLCVVPLLAGCGGSGGGKIQSASTSRRPPTAVRTPVRRPVPPTAQVQMLPGLEGVIGSSAADLNRQFGTARLDVWEGDGRKLQYSGAPCILDVYLYPPAQGREPQATYVDARRTDGRDVDRADCIAALRKR